MSYDYDLIVIGGGPAGIAAAFRARWLRTWKTFPLSVAIIDNNPLGGISRWKQVILTNPSFIFSGDELAKKMSADFDKFPIDVISEEVLSTELNGDIKKITTNKRKYYCLGVVIATGLRHNHNEKDYITKGLIPTLKGHTFMAQVLEKAISENQGKKFLVVGSKKVHRFWRFFEKINNKRVNSELFVEDEKSRIVKLEGSNHLEKVVVIKNGGQTEIKTDFLVFDFESYMLHTDTANIFDVEKETGLIKVDYHMQTNKQRVYAAGDCTGGPFGIAKSIGNGVSAGFSAFRDIFIRKFKIEPSMYAFFGHSAEEISEKTGFFIPKLKDRYRPKLLRKSVDSDLEIIKKFDGKTTVEELKKNYSIEEIRKTVETLAEKKEVTFHV